VRHGVRSASAIHARRPRPSLARCTAFRTAFRTVLHVTSFLRHRLDVTAFQVSAVHATAFDVTAFCVAAFY
jgi:hypothetical protein